MTASGNIQYLTHQQIDKIKWDNCIDASANGLIYGYSFYLDCMSPDWGALVLNDYTAVMPLTWRKKYGISYLYQPFLTAQLGVFGNKINAGITDQFIKKIPSFFKLVEISLNSSNIINTFQDFVTKRKNYTLHLNKPYQELYNSYNDNAKRNSKKAMEHGCSLTKDFDIEKVIALALQQMKRYGKEPAENVTRFRNLYNVLAEKDMAATYGIISAEKKLLASCVFFYSHHRAYYILVGNCPDSKSTGASHALIDGFIKDHAGKDLILDFEGSDIPGLALFYGGFGASLETYPFLKINGLPFYLKWLKK